MVHKSPQKKKPFVSVVIPFLDNQQEVLQVEKRLRMQSYPSDCMETIFIDNGSAKSCTFTDAFLQRNLVLQEKNYLRSPYSARNRGIEAATGEIIVFLDANSIPEKNWLESGVECLEETGADIAGGNVEFDFKNRATAGKIVDSLTSINMKNVIQERGAAYTANLFVRKRVFDSIGLFEEGVRSGGDVRWTLRAKNNGFSISFCERAVVKKFARSTKELYRKKIRTGKGYYYTWKKESIRKIWFYNFLRSLKPPSFSSIQEIKPGGFESEFNSKLPAIWLHFYLSGIVEQLSFIVEYIRDKVSSS